MNIENEVKYLDILINDKKINLFYIKLFEIEGKVNEHKLLNIRFEINYEEKSYIEKNLEKNFLEIKVYLKNNRKLFDGIIEYLELLNYGNNGYEVVIKGISKTIFLDKQIEKKFRAFQDKTTKIENIIEEINNNYKGKLEVKYKKEDNDSIDNLLIQFKETDWEFLQRIASIYGKCIFIMENGLVSIGLLSQMEIKEENKKISDFSMIHDKENFYYKVFSKNIISLGENIILNKENSVDKIDEKKSDDCYSVVKARNFLKNGIIMSEVLVTSLSSYKIYKKENKEIRGSCIEAKVTNILNDKGIAKVEVEFYTGLQKIVDSEKESKNKYKAYEDYGELRIPLSYKTFYSQRNTGFFCTPEVGDIVEVYFPSNDESMAKVSWSVNNPGNGRFSDYDKRNFQTSKSGFEFILKGDNLKLNIKESYIKNTKNHLEVSGTHITKTSGTIVLATGKYLGIESNGESNLYGNKINIHAKDGDVKITSHKSVLVKGKKIHNN